MDDRNYEAFLRDRITELRMQKNVSEHRMSLDLGKSGSYIRGVTNGSSLPSVRELFNIITYLGVTPVEFFAPLEDADSRYARLCKKMRNMSEADLEKVETFFKWIDN